MHTKSRALPGSFLLKRIIACGHPFTGPIHLTGTTCLPTLRFQIIIILTQEDFMAFLHRLCLLCFLMLFMAACASNMGIPDNASKVRLTVPGCE
jgi:hypothetical protein